MKWVTLVMLGALAYVHFHLWLGDDGWEHYLQLQERVQTQTAANEESRQRNETLKAELADLNSGGDAVGELARFELGHIMAGETFYRIVPELQVHATVTEMQTAIAKDLDAPEPIVGVDEEPAH